MAVPKPAVDYYNDQAKLYSDPKIRPKYPPAVFEKVYAFAGPGTEVALDVATGTGQSARQLAERFQQVYAVDASEEQIKHCEPHRRITFRHGLAESTGLPDDSVDLVTAASALHWLDVPAFYAEARRVLKPGGALAAWSYYIPQIKGHAHANDLLGTVWHGALGPYKEEAQLRCERQYSGLEPGKEDFGVVERAMLAFDYPSTIWHLVQFLRTSGAYAKWRRANSGKPDPLEIFREQLVSTLHAADDTMQLTLQYPVFMILAKDPRPL